MSEFQKDGGSQLAKQRLTQVFQFLKELNQQRNPPVRQVSDQKWNLSLGTLPEHPAIQLGSRTASAPSTEDELPGNLALGDNNAVRTGNNLDFVLRVRRAKLTSCPSPPNAIQDWLQQTWESPFVAEAAVHVSRNEVDRNGETVIVRFDDDLIRVEMLSAWKKTRGEWCENELLARAALSIYEQLSALRGTLQRDSEKFDLVLGDGVLIWNDPTGNVFHPVFLQQVQLEFDATIPEFTVVDADTESELYLPLLNSLADVDPKNIAHSRNDLTKQTLHPMMEEASPFLKELATRMFTNGELIHHEVLPRNSEIPLIGRSPYLFLRDRVQGYSAAIDKVLETMERRTDICSGLFKIVGVDIQDRTIGADTKTSGPHDQSPIESNRDEILFGKFANQQQFEIAVQRQIQCAS